MQFKRYFPVVLMILILTAACSTSRNTGATNKGFVSIFDGETLNGWKGDTTYWHAGNGILTGLITPATILKRNTFVIWQGGTPSDFELKLDYRISDKGNSGLNYRSSLIDTLPYAMKGYQADIDGKFGGGLGYPKYAGQNYEERGRTFLAWRGQRTVIETGKKPMLLDSLGSSASLAHYINSDDWNTLLVVAKGNNLKHYINGHLMCEVTDNDATNRTMSGLIGVQVHVGPPMKVEYRNIMIRQ